MLVAAGLVAGVAWLTDFVTLTGEWTIYTASCTAGRWEGRRCTGKMGAGDRYRFRALPAHREVLFWLVGSPEPSGKFTECSIHNGRSWTCKASPDASRTITLALDRGKPVRDDTGAVRSFHALAKWRWLLANAGLPVGDEANP